MRSMVEGVYPPPLRGGGSRRGAARPLELGRATRYIDVLLGKITPVGQIEADAGINSAILTAARCFLDRLPPHLAPLHTALYGSRARGDHRADSDVDLAVTLQGPRGNRYGVAAVFSDIAYDIMDETGIVIHAMPLWQSDWAEPQSFGNPALLILIKREGRPL